jgi:adenylate cyclase class 2
MTSSDKELEVKFFTFDLVRFEKTLGTLGAVLVQPRTYERNLRFDTPTGSLTKNMQVLRLRKDSANRLTYKGPGEVKDGVAARNEIEFTVDDFEKAQALLEALGYRVSMIYEKYRTAYQLEGTLVTLDQMPFGDFVEIEGADGTTIKAVCHQLGLLWDRRILQSYAALFRTVQHNLDLSFRDLTFESFAPIKVRPSHLGVVPADMN